MPFGGTANYDIVLSVAKYPRHSNLGFWTTGEEYSLFENFVCVEKPKLFMICVVEEVDNNCKQSIFNENNHAIDVLCFAMPRASRALGKFSKLDLRF